LAKAYLIKALIYYIRIMKSYVIIIATILN